MELKPEPLKLDLAFLKECTQHSSHTEKAQIWKDWNKNFEEGIEAAQKKGLPEYQWQNYGRRRANCFIREKVNRRREILSSL